MPAVEVRDLPQLWQQPPFEALLCGLRQLRLAPPIWNTSGGSSQTASSDSLTSSEDGHGEDEGEGGDEWFSHRDQAQSRRDVAIYLSSIVGNPLQWLDDDDQREQVWEEASRRLAERCGRTAMPSMTRHWSFAGSETTSGRPFSLAIREPALTGDCLGLKTWGSSYALARMLRALGESSAALAHLFVESPRWRDDDGPPLDVLELGAGTGLLGLAAAAVWGPAVRVVVTDLGGDVAANLQFNVAQNRTVVEDHAGGWPVEAAVLTWGGGGVAGDEEEEGGGGGEGSEDMDPRFCGAANANRFPLILAADPLYDDDQPALLATAVDGQMARTEDARAVIMVPLRDRTTEKLLEAFKREMAGRGCRLVGNEAGVVFGQDDWEEREEDEEGAGVRCWYGVFGR